MSGSFIKVSRGPISGIFKFIGLGGVCLAWIDTPTTSSGSVFSSSRIGVGVGVGVETAVLGLERDGAFSPSGLGIGGGNFGVSELSAIDRSILADETMSLKNI